ncbi:hypothetical protein LTR50_002654 [Elasticomyces elasticus]|nr:hypothetical protein LTR50_002654 [Elasticomyces elasticus]
MSRPTSQHRNSTVSTASSLPRQSYSRTHSHSASAAVNPAHRVTRRKSTASVAASNVAALAAAVNAATITPLEPPNTTSRRTSTSRAALGSRSSHLGSYPSPPSSLPHQATVPEHFHYGVSNGASNGVGGSALVDGPALASMSQSEKGDTKARLRRASEGSRLSKDRKTVTGDLKCETCGKGYKHSSCLTKHLWEHTPEWAFTSKLLISKHQQVQLLEAASVLVAMNAEAATAEAAKPHDSDNSSASPAASGSSGQHEDGLSSTETTPPPQLGDGRFDSSKRFSNTSSAYSRSYQSVFSTSEGGAGAHHDFGHYRQWSLSSNRPTTAGTSIADSYPDEDQADLAAAVGLLSCSYGTPKSGPIQLPNDVPPVPPLPAQYQGLHSTTFAPATQHGKTQHVSYRAPQHQDVEMDDNGDEDEEESDDERHFVDRRIDRRRPDEADEGVFGHMEE